MHVTHVFAAAAGFSEIWTVYCCIIMVETDVDVEIEVEVLVVVDVLVEVEVDVLVEVDIVVVLLDVDDVVDEVVDVVVVDVVVVGVALAMRQPTKSGIVPIFSVFVSGIHELMPPVLFS